LAGQHRVEAGLAQAYNDLPGYGQALLDTASDSEPDWRMKQAASLEHFSFLLSCIKIYATIAWAAGHSNDASDMS
jgi:hypothetical protein